MNTDMDIIRKWKEMGRDLARLGSRRWLDGWDGMGTLYLDSGMNRII